MRRLSNSSPGRRLVPDCPGTLPSDLTQGLCFGRDGYYMIRTVSASGFSPSLSLFPLHTAFLIPLYIPYQRQPFLCPSLLMTPPLCCHPLPTPAYHVPPCPHRHDPLTVPSSSPTPVPFNSAWRNL